MVEKIGFRIQSYIVEAIALVLIGFTWGPQRWFVALLALVLVMLVAIRIDATDWYLKTKKQMPNKDIFMAIGLVVMAVLVFFLGTMFAS